MKCDKLKPIRQGSVELGEYWVYDADEVDSAIDEIKREHHRERDEYIEMVAQLKAELVEQESENRRLKRALYKACANWADCKACILEYVGVKLHAKKWERMFNKCRAKAEEYK